MLVLAAPVVAQRAPNVEPIDTFAEHESLHNLDVGRQYFKKKAWTGAAGRLEEIVATYPEFTKIDEVYYLLGVVYTKTDKNDEAREMFKRLLDERPDSDFAKKAREELDRLGNP